MDDSRLTTLPMNSKKQSAILGHLILNQDFFLLAHRKIQGSWFSHVYHTKIYNYLVEIYKTVNRFPTIVELINWTNLTLEEEAIKNAIINYINICLEDSQQIGLDLLKPELIDWLHSKILYNSMEKASRFWNNERFKESALCLEEAVKEYHESKFEESSEVKFDDIHSFIPKITESHNDCLTTGLTLLDEALLENAVDGGLQKGDITIVLAPVNLGKTSTLITIAAHNILNSKSVLFMSHEGRPDDLRIKMLKSVGNLSEKDILDLYKTQEGIEALINLSNLVKKHLVYLPYNKAGMNVEDVIPVIRTAQQQQKMKTGKGFDLFVCDYPAKLGTERASKGNMQTRHVIDYVYEQYVQLALENNWHSLVAFQTNREGSKINKGVHQGISNRLLTMEDAAEAWGPMTAASNVITINRSEMAKKNNRITFYVAKSRSNETGIAVCARSNFSHCRTHGNDMGAVSYFGTKPMEDNIDAYLMTMKNQKLSSELLINKGI